MNDYTIDQILDMMCQYLVKINNGSEDLVFPEDSQELHDIKERCTDFLKRKDVI